MRSWDLRFVLRLSVPVPPTPHGSFPKARFDCGVMKVGSRCIRWKIVGQISPFASVIYEIQYSIYQFPLFPFAPVSCSGKQRLYLGPLSIAQITRITASFIFLYHAPSIAPSYLCIYKKTAPRQTAKYKRYIWAENSRKEREDSRFAFHLASFLRFTATNLSLTHLETWARPL